MSSPKVIHVNTTNATPDSADLFDESFTIHFHNFENMTTEVGVVVDSPTFWCAGWKWSLSIYPGGYNDSYDD
jgi:hypothetical protein